MPSLTEALSDPTKRRRVVDDGVAMIDAEVADKGGLSGMAIKGAFAMVQKVRPGFVGGALNHLLDDFAKQVDPFWAECQAKREDPRAFFVRRGGEVANALLAITDMRAKGATGPVRSTYDKLRPQAVEHVKAAMPRLADLLKKHAS
ncbi:MAG: DUF6918 family protein [Myxococcota bacterium]